jgi:uncharacterized protein with GYD domain
LSVLWILPLVFLAVGTGVIVLAARQASESAAGLRDECARLAEVRDALVELGAEASVTRSTLDHIRTRRESTADRR